MTVWTTSLFSGGNLAARCVPALVVIVLAGCGVDRSGSGASAARSPAPASSHAARSTSPAAANLVSGGTKPVAACALVSSAEATAALGTSVDQGHEYDSDANGQQLATCDHMAGDSAVLGIDVRAPADQAVLAAARSRVAGAAHVQDTTGVGDVGFRYWTAVPGGVGGTAAVLFLKGGYEVTIALTSRSSGFDGSGSAERLQTLATKAAGRL
jgi:hypothetical protein